MLPKQPNQSLIDGLACLQMLAGTDQPLGVRQLARQLGLESTRTHRLLKTLAHLGLAQQDADSRYQVGPGIHVLAAMSLFSSGILRAALQPLEKLHQHNLVVALGVLWRSHVSYLYHWQPNLTSAQAIARVGFYPATLSGLGMILLSQQSPAEVQSLFDHSEIPGYVDGLPALLPALQVIRTQGYAEIHRTPQESTLAIALTGLPNMSLGLAGDYSPSQRDTLLTALQQTAQEITQNTKDQP